MRTWQSFGLIVMTAALVVSCVPQQSSNRPGSSVGDSGQGSPTLVKKITAAMMGNPPTPYEKVIGGGSGGRIPGITGLEQLVSAGLTILDRRGQAVDPASIDWQSATPATFPYTLRQPPGANNALGRVKFIFPNEHAIFLHDTPSRELFSADRRTFSSGCIRAERPLELAARLLEPQEWATEKIQQVVDGGASQTVVLDTPMPVLIVYWTISVGASGDLRIASDVYHRDPPLVRALNRRD